MSGAEARAACALPAQIWIARAMKTRDLGAVAAAVRHT
jgi:hypothetical protein